MLRKVHYFCQEDKQAKHTMIPKGQFCSQVSMVEAGKEYCQIQLFGQMDNKVVCKVAHLVMWLVLQDNLVNCTQYHKGQQFFLEDKVEESPLVAGIFVCNYQCSRDDGMFRRVYTHLMLLMCPSQRLQMLQHLQLPLYPQYSFQLMEERLGSSWQEEDCKVDSWEDSQRPMADWQDNFEVLVYCSKGFYFQFGFQFCFYALDKIMLTFFIQHDLLSLNEDICTDCYAQLKSFKIYLFQIVTLHSKLITFPHLPI